MKYSQNLRKLTTTIIFCVISLICCLSLSSNVGAQEPGEIFSGQGGVNRTGQDTSDPGYIPPPVVRQGQDTADPGYIPGTGGVSGGTSVQSTGGATSNSNATGGNSNSVDGNSNSSGGSSNSGGNNSNSTGGNINPSSGSTGSRSILNPLACSPGAQAKGQCIPELLFKVIDIILVFALPIIVLYIMYAGYLFVTAAGNSEKISAARSALLWSIIGGVIVLGARIIVTIIQGTISGLA